MRNVSNKSHSEDQNTHFVLTFLLETLAVCEIMSKNVLEPEMPQKTRRMRVACWLRKATRTRTSTRPRARPHTRTKARAHTKEYVILIVFFKATMVLRLSVTLYVHYISCYDREEKFTARYELSLQI